MTHPGTTCRMDPVARKIVGVLAVIAGIILGVVALVTSGDPVPWLAGGVIAASVAAGVLLL